MTLLVNDIGWGTLSGRLDPLWTSRRLPCSCVVLRTDEISSSKLDGVRVPAQSVYSVSLSPLILGPVDLSFPCDRLPHPPPAWRRLEVGKVAWLLRWIIYWHPHPKGVHILITPQICGCYFTWQKGLGRCN